MKTRVALIVFPLIAALSLAGCEKKSASNEKAKTNTTVAQVEEGEWCAEHGVPESICTRCNSKLVAGFKQKGDWCDQHNLPRSQCVDCDPTLKAKFEAMAPKK